MKPFAAGLAAALLGSTTYAAPAPLDDAKLQLDPVEVLGNPEPLDQELARLRKRIKESTPCMGCDAAVKARDSIGEKFYNYVFNSTPPEPSRQDRDDRYYFCINAGPGMDNVC
ncbi:MAG TPA: hypothetical protein VM029_16565 [Opitutaceae bacterium]|nr:hypothetical protein [Opitutaceae bacterium]